MSIGERIKLAREAANLTQEELGQRCGTTKQSIYKYENGIVTNIPLDRIEKIASITGVSATYLMDWENEKPIVEIDDELSEFIQLFRSLPPERKKDVKKFIDYQIHESKQSHEQ